jgi:hypothetical protein
MGAPAVLIYDGDCAMCRASALWLMRRALGSGADELEILPCRSPARRARFPAIDEAACLTAMQLVLPDGRVLSGAARLRPAGSAAAGAPGLRLDRCQSHEAQLSPSPPLLSGPRPPLPAD